MLQCGRHVRIKCPQSGANMLPASYFMRYLCKYTLILVTNCKLLVVQVNRNCTEYLAVKEAFIVEILRSVFCLIVNYHGNHWWCHITLHIQSPDQYLWRPP